jgi:hypothetical protein
VQSAGANMGASVVASASPAASREVGFNLQGTVRGLAAFRPWPRFCGRLATQRMRAVDAAESARNRPISNRHSAIRNGCKLLKRKDRCTV